MAQSTTQKGDLAFNTSPGGLAAFEVLAMRDPIHHDQPLNFALPVVRLLKNTLQVVSLYKTFLGLSEAAFLATPATMLVTALCRAARMLPDSLFNCDGWMGPYLLHSCLLGWVQAGLPYLEVEPKTAAYLVGTKVTGEVLGSVVPPWQTFLVVLPDGFFVESRGRLVPLKYTWVRYGADAPDDGKWVFFSVSGTELGPELWSVNIPSEVVGEEERVQSEFGEVSLTSHDQRTRQAIERLVLGLCLTLSQPEHKALAPLTPPKRPKGTNAVLWAKKYAHMPLGKGFVFGHPVPVDCVAEVREYLSGRDTHAVTVRSIVRRHWKMQVCGPRGQDRKPIVVEPYERGPKGAPLVVRPHRVKNERTRPGDENTER